MAGGTRDGKGKFTRTVATAERDAEAAALRAQGRTFEEIARELGLPSRAKAHEAVQRAFAGIPYEGVEEARRLDLERIDRLIAKAWQVMDRDHVTVSHGKIMTRQVGVERDADGIERLDHEGKTIPVYEDILDDAPALAAIREIRMLLERRAKIIGYDAPSKSRVEVITQDVFTAALAQLEAEVGANGADRGTAGAGSPLPGTAGEEAPAGG